MTILAHFFITAVSQFICISVDDGQSKRPQYTGLRNAVKVIFKQEGVKGLYRGVTPNVAGAGTAWGFYFLL